MHSALQHPSATQRRGGPKSVMARTKEGAAITKWNEHLTAHQRRKASNGECRHRSAGRTPVRARGETHSRLGERNRGCVDARSPMRMVRCGGRECSLRIESGAVNGALAFCRARASWTPAVPAFCHDFASHPQGPHQAAPHLQKMGQGEFLLQTGIYSGPFCSSLAKASFTNPALDRIEMLG